MQKSFASSIYLILLTCILPSCHNKWEEPPPPAENQDVDNNNFVLTGRWEWVIAVGGHVGLDSVTHREREPNSIVFDANGEYRSFIRERQVEGGKYRFSREKTADRDSVIKIQFATVDTVGGEFIEYEMLVSMKNDTLSLYPYGCNDCLTDYYKKVQ